MFDQELNLETTQGVLGVTKRKLLTMTIHKHTNGTYFVTNDKDGSFRSGGHKSPEEAVAMNEREDHWRLFRED